MATDTGTRSSTGIGVGGGLVIAGIVVALFWSLLLGIIIALVGLVAFGGFAKGKWYLAAARRRQTRCSTQMLLASRATTSPSACNCNRL